MLTPIAPSKERFVQREESGRQARKAVGDLLPHHDWTTSESRVHSQCTRGSSSKCNASCRETRLRRDTPDETVSTRNNLVISRVGMVSIDHHMVLDKAR